MLVSSADGDDKPATVGGIGEGGERRAESEMERRAAAAAESIYFTRNMQKKPGAMFYQRGERRLGEQRQCS